MSALVLRPFWRYYGGKWRACQRGAYPQPVHATIIEPFAGAAGYSLRYGAERDVILIEKYTTIAAIWRWLIGADPQQILAIPEVDDVDNLPDWVPQPARWLVGFSMNSACSTPRKTLSAGRRALRAQHRQFEGWTPALRERVATQVQYIRHWRVVEGDYTVSPDIGATWFVDPPYQVAGKHYVHGARGLAYDALAEWCKSRRGQTIVCEQRGATWLPFRELGTFHAGPTSRSSAEAIWP